MFNGELINVSFAPISPTFVYVSDCGVYYWVEFKSLTCGQVTDWEGVE